MKNAGSQFDFPMGIKSIWFPTFFKISSFVFVKILKRLWVDYPFKLLTAHFSYNRNISQSYKNEH